MFDGANTTAGSMIIAVAAERVGVYWNEARGHNRKRRALAGAAVRLLQQNIRCSTHSKSCNARDEGSRVQITTAWHFFSKVAALSLER